MAVGISACDACNAKPTVCLLSQAINGSEPMQGFVGSFVGPQYGPGENGSAGCSLLISTGPGTQASDRGLRRGSAVGSAVLDRHLRAARRRTSLLLAIAAAPLPIAATWPPFLSTATRTYQSPPSAQAPTRDTS